MEITYILQITTIVITLFLGVITYLQTHRIQEGQNIISVTTKYRSERCEQLKEVGTSLLSNTSARLLSLSADATDMLKAATEAQERIGMILHRDFEADRRLIELSSDLLEAAFDYVDKKSGEALNKLLYFQERFRLKCDLYTAADWNRIKQETKGQNTSSQSWEDYYAKLEEKHAKDFDEIERRYMPDPNE